MKWKGWVPCSRNPALTNIFVRTMCNRRPLEAIEFVYGAKRGKIHDKVISVLGRLGQVQAIKRDSRWRRQRIMRCTQPICARNGKSAHLRVHTRSEGQQLLKFGARRQVRDIAEGVEYGEGCTCVLDDLMSEEAREGGIVCAAGQFRLARAWEPLEKKDESADGLKGHQRGWVEGVEVVDDKRYAE